MTMKSVLRLFPLVLESQGIDILKIKAKINHTVIIFFFLLSVK